MYKKYKRGINITDEVDTVLISAGVFMAGIGLTMPVMLPLEIAASVCGCISVGVNLVRRKLTSEVQKHNKIKAIADSKINSIKDLISKALRDGQISDDGSV